MAHRGSDRLRDLADQLIGVVVAPGEPGWDSARAAWNLAIDQRPSAVVVPRDAHDVAVTLRFAAESGLQVVVQATGHHAGESGDLSGAILLKTHELSDVRVDATSRTVRAQSGVVWRQVVEAAAVHDLAPLAGTAGSVGVVGYTLGGGIGWLSREFGLCSSSVLELELVTGDGEVRVVDADHDADLFWALRGGGGAFAIVTAIELRLYPVASLYAGAMFWPIDRARDVLATWVDWVETVPSTLSSCARLFNFPAIPQVPELLRGRSMVGVEVAFRGDAVDGAPLVEAMRDLRPELDDLRTIGASELLSLHRDPPNPSASHGDGFALDAFPLAAVDSLLGTVAARRSVPLVSVEVRRLGGALAQVAAGAGALARIDSAYVVYCAGVVGPATDDQLGAAVEAIRAALSPWSSARNLSNFSHRDRDVRSFFAPSVCAKLMQTKRRHDPHDVVRGGLSTPKLADDREVRPPSDV